MIEHSRRLVAKDWRLIPYLTDKIRKVTESVVNVELSFYNFLDIYHVWISPIEVLLRRFVNQID